MSVKDYSLSFAVLWSCISTVKAICPAHCAEMQFCCETRCCSIYDVWWFWVLWVTVVLTALSIAIYCCVRRKRTQGVVLGLRNNTTVTTTTQVVTNPYGTTTYYPPGPQCQQYTGQATLLMGPPGMGQGQPQMGQPMAGQPLMGQPTMAYFAPPPPYETIAKSY